MLTELRFSGILVKVMNNLMPKQERKRMMIEHFEDFTSEGKKCVIARVRNCKYDAVKIICKQHPHIKGVQNAYYNIVDKRTGKSHTKLMYGLEKAVIKDTYEVSVVLAEGDTYDREEGIRLADIKLKKAMGKAIKAAVKRWENYQLGIFKNIESRV